MILRPQLDESLRKALLDLTVEFGFSDSIADGFPVGTSNDQKKQYRTESGTLRRFLANG
jgi:hypothetical protein